MIRSFTSAWVRLLAHIWNLFRLRVLVLLLFTVLTGFLDGLGMALLLPLLTLVGVDSAPSGTVAAAVDRAFRIVGLQPTLETVLGAILFLFVLQGVIVLIQGQMIASVESAYVSHWRETLLERLLSASWPYFSKSRSGSLVYLVITEAERLGRAFFLTIQLIAALVVAVAYVAISAAISLPFTLGLLGSLVVLSAILFQLSSRSSYKAGQDYGRHLGELQAVLTEFMTGAKVIKATAAEPFVLEQVRPIHEDIERTYFSGVIIPYVLRAVLELAAIVLFCVLIYIGVRFLDLRPAVLLVVLALFFRLVPRVHLAQYNVQLLLTYLPAFERLEEAIAEMSRMSEPYPIDSREKPFLQAPAIVMDNITVTYDDRDALTNVSVTIPANSTVGVVGPSGAGKSTLVDCMVGLVRPRHGAITLDGVPLGNVNLRQWRSSIGYVAQETVLFTGTVRDIIRQGRSIADDVLMRAARQAHAHPFIMELPKGYDTLIGGLGVQLSGGQKQRLSLARALAGRPVLLMLDEPTSALDSASEKEIVAAIRELHGTITIVIVSHRRSTVEYADRSVALDKGRIAVEHSIL